MRKVIQAEVVEEYCDLCGKRMICSFGQMCLEIPNINLLDNKIIEMEFCVNCVDKIKEAVDRIKRRKKSPLFWNQKK